MPKVVSITFEGNNKKYYFGSIDNLRKFDKVVVETVRGLEIGTVVEEEKMIDDSEVIGELRNVIRVAQEKDLESYEANKAVKPELMAKCKELVSASGLDMKLLDVEYTLDRAKLILYFSADGRVDFRELIKDIVAVYKTRIELRQVGPRDASRIVGGIGICGRKLCCSEFLGDIQNITIKMAKNQNLALNPNAISGLCGKLLCCIGYEDESYQHKKENETQEKEQE